MNVIEIMLYAVIFGEKLNIGVVLECKALIN